MIRCKARKKETASPVLFVRFGRGWAEKAGDLTGLAGGWWMVSSNEVTKDSSYGDRFVQS